MAISTSTSKSFTARNFPLTTFSTSARRRTLIAEFDEPTVAILKHTNPCGVGSDADLRKAWNKAFATDKQAPFGGIIICNRPLTEALAKVISEIFQRGNHRARFDPKRARLAEEKEPASYSIGTPASRRETRG